MTKISAKIIADSKNEHSERITTFVLTFPRYILAEFNTHRMLSKNSASSRAIPFKKMLKSVHTNPFIPIAWMKDHSGMQGSEYFEGWKVSIIKFFWILASKFAILSALILNKLGLTKQLVNRILEPFMWHTVITTGSEFQNFFALRASEFADIHIQKLAYEMLNVYNESTPKQLKAGEWHIPFGDKIDILKLNTIANGNYDMIAIGNDEVDPDYHSFINENVENNLIKIATARCARVSYTVVGEENKPDNYENDVKLHDRLKASGHFSPFEHIARAMSDEEYQCHTHTTYNPEKDSDHDIEHGWSGNFRGFIQYRKMLDNENKTDSRVLIK